MIQRDLNCLILIQNLSLRLLKLVLWVLLQVRIEILRKGIVGRSDPRLWRRARHKEWIWIVVQVCVGWLLRRGGHFITVRRIGLRVREWIILLMQRLLLVGLWWWWIVVVGSLIEIISLLEREVRASNLLTIIVCKSPRRSLVDTALINALRWESNVIDCPDVVIVAKHRRLVMLSDLHDVPRLFHLELIISLVIFFYFDYNGRLLLLFSLSQVMIIISTQNSFSRFGLRLLFNNLLFEHLHHLFLLLLLLSLLHHCHCSGFFASLGFVYFLKVFLDL